MVGGKMWITGGRGCEQQAPGELRKRFWMRNWLDWKNRKALDFTR
jgi:hypothetical protein